MTLQLDPVDPVLRLCIDQSGVQTYAMSVKADKPNEACGS